MHANLLLKFKKKYKKSVKYAEDSRMGVIDGIDDNYPTSAIIAGENYNRLKKTGCALAGDPGRLQVVSVRPDPDQPERSSNNANEDDAIWERGMGGPQCRQPGGLPWSDGCRGREGASRDRTLH
jgi:hypothetical protein